MNDKVNCFWDFIVCVSLYHLAGTTTSDIEHSTWSLGEYAALEESVKRLCISLDTLCEDVLSPSSSLSLSRECTTIHARSCVVLCTTIHARSCVVLYHDTHTSCVVLIDVEFYTTEKFTVHAEEKTQPQLSPLSLHWPWASTVDFTPKLSQVSPRLCALETVLETLSSTVDEE